MAKFELAHAKTSIHEGGYSNDPVDRGGETYMGITRSNFPFWMGWAIVDNRKPLQNGATIDSPELNALVAELYKELFWNKLKCSQFRNQDIANEVYDTAVNMGAYGAIKILQRGINLLIDGEIKVDGIIGSVTISYVNTVNSAALLKTLNGLQFMRYVDICEADATQERFFKGWLKRT